jgi:hypothetical protein
VRFYNKRGTAEQPDNADFASFSGHPGSVPSVPRRADMGLEGTPAAPLPPINIRKDDTPRG